MPLKYDNLSYRSRIDTLLELSSWRFSKFLASCFHFSETHMLPLLPSHPAFVSLINRSQDQHMAIGCRLHLAKLKYKSSKFSISAFLRD